MEFIVLSVKTATIKTANYFTRYGPRNIPRQASGQRTSGSQLQGLAIMGATGGALAIQPGGPIRNIIDAALNDYFGELIIFTSL